MRNSEVIPVREKLCGFSPCCGKKPSGYTSVVTIPLLLGSTVNCVEKGCVFFHRVAVFL
jgi:hypothetical protein